MSEERIVTLDEIRTLIKTEKIKPENLFSEDDLKPLKDEGRAAGYAEAKADMEKERDKPDEAERYINPATNPLIKTGNE